MILSYLALRHIVQNKIMTPVPDEHINAASIDVTLGPTLLVEAYDAAVPDDELRVVDLGRREALTFDTVTLDDEPFLLYPGQFALAQSAEKFYLPLDVAAEFRLKSSAARMGLSHILGVWCDPGWTNSVLTMELHNVTTQHVIALRRGDRIGQMVFHQCEPVPRERSYAVHGRYNNDASAQASKPAE